jgi:branched-chain amino acid transport system substrate-binding protein
MIVIKFKKSLLLLFSGVFVILILINAGAQTIRVENVQYVPDVEVTFSEGINEYRNDNYEKATQIFQALFNQSPTHQRITAVYLMLGKCYYQLAAYEKSISILSELINKYPQSNYLDDAHYSIGFCYYALGKYVNSLNEFLYLADNGKEKKLVEKSRNNALRVIENNIAFNELQIIEQNKTGEMASAIITIKLSQRYLDRGDRDRAVSLLQNFILQYPENPYLSNVKQLLTRTNTAVSSAEVRVGVILPLSGGYHEQAKAVLAGIQYSQKKFNDNSDVRVSLVIKDSEGDIAKLVQVARELARDDRVVAIIGELERDKTIAIAAVTNGSNIPLIAPTTSGNGVASLNNYTFQVNSDVENRGRLLAKYAIEQLGLKTFATLAPADNYGKDMTDSFTSMVDELGGNIIAQKWYYADAQDLNRQFKSIRDLGFKLANKDSLVKHYMRELDDFKFEKVPVISVDGIFFPCYTQDIQYIAPQFAFANINARVLGGEYWYDFEKLRLNQKYLEGMIFCSGYYFDETNPEFIKFRNDFRLVMKRTPEIMELYGYDAMQTLADAIMHKQTTRQGIRDHLDHLENFSGIRGPITFRDNNRVNAGVRILTYKNGRIEALR